MPPFRLFAFVFVLFTSPAVAANQTVESAVDRFVRPTYVAFQSTARQMRLDMETLCAEPAPRTYVAAKNTFEILVETWSQAEIIRFGPITEENRLERVLFWPDRKSIGLKQVQAALAEKDTTATDPETLKGKSVAMQGLGALEFVLFGTHAESLEQPGDPYRCAYGLAVAKNVEAIASETLAGWNDQAGVAWQWANPSAGNTLFRTDDESLGELLDTLVNGLELLRDVRINGFLGETTGADKPRQAIFWRSGATVVSLNNNMRGLQKLFEASDMARLLPDDSAWIAQSINFEFNTADTFFDKAAGPTSEILKDDRRDALVAVRLITSHLSDLFGTNLAGALNLTAGFSSLDGD